MNSMIIRGETAELENGTKVIPLTEDCVRLEADKWFVEITFNEEKGRLELYAERAGYTLALFDETVEFHPNDVIDKHLHLFGTSMYNVHDIRFAIDLISSGKVRAGAMVTHILPLEEAQRGFELAATKNDGAIKVVLEMGD